MSENHSFEEQQIGGICYTSREKLIRAITK